MGKGNLKKGLIVSIQKYSQSTTQELAEKAIEGGAIAIRTDQHIMVDVPVIALEKLENKKFYITTTRKAIKNCIWGQYVAIDSRKGNIDIDLLYSYCHINEINIVADIANIEDVYNLLAICAKLKLKTPKFIATTFSMREGYPNLLLIQQIKKCTRIPIIAEGGYSNTAYITAAMQNGANLICIGTAISDIKLITKEYQEFIYAYDSAAQVGEY
jgi:N-acylglucosamine-6-phosphate 2-epimerase